MIGDHADRDPAAVDRRCGGRPIRSMACRSGADRVTPSLPPQRLASLVEPRPHGAFGDAEDRGDLGVAEAIDREQRQDHTLLRRKGVDRPLDLSDALPHGESLERMDRAGRVLGVSVGAGWGARTRKAVRTAIR
jgi:hypothetical protein